MYLASASPPVRWPNVYGVDMPTRREFVACDRSEEQIRAALGADGLLYQARPSAMPSPQAKTHTLTLTLTWLCQARPPVKHSPHGKRHVVCSLSCHKGAA